jgi:chromate reductase, NAD(P)H dehydrogenase (quinone)
MAQDRSVAVLVGSLRKASFSRRVARALAGLAPDNLRLDIVEIRHLPLYDQDPDDEKRPPEAWVTFRNTIRAANAVLFVTPEYNRSVPGALKNAIDVGSRPYGQSAWDGKPTAVISVSPGAIGGFGANHAIRQSLVFLNMPVLQMEAYISNVATMFAEVDDSITADTTREFLRNFMTRYAAWIETILP